MNKIVELEKELGKILFLSPGWSDKDLIKISYRYEFEPHGKASETWEEVWVLELPFIQYYFKNSKGEWGIGAIGLSARFKGNDLYALIDKAIKYLKEAKPIPIDRYGKYA